MNSPTSKMKMLN